VLLRGLLATVVMGTVFAAAYATLGPTSAPPTEGADNTSPTLSLAPISLGNPAAAATLTTRNPVFSTGNEAQSAVYGQTLRVGRGDTLAGMLTSAGVSGEEAHAAIQALAKVYNPRRIKPGQAVTINFRAIGEAKADDRFLGLTLDVDFARLVNVKRDGDQFAADESKKELIREPAWAGGTISANLFDDAATAGVPVPVIVNLIRLYSWDVDFQRGIHPGDTFQVMYQKVFDANDKLVHNGAILSAVLTLRGRRLPVYRHTTADDLTDYFDDEGRSARKALMRTPIDGARLSSGYGRRRHPVLGYTRMHKGVDFAAPRGTPIYAAGNGSITHAGRKGGYGKYVRIRHNNQYSTAYAHMNRIARGVRRGRRVSQGQIIGYVGSTGRSTGPHLHYEILAANRQVNPLTLKMPSGRRLAGAEFKRYQDARRKLESLASALSSGHPVAQLTD
jgi:murein DD-endopeptidase MepM/ murein hydrolase activator NlpD